MLGCFNPTLGQIWTNPAVGLNIYITFFKPKVGLVHIWLKVGLNNLAFFRVYKPLYLIFTLFFVLLLFDGSKEQLFKI